jgi:hypothetical protein
MNKISIATVCALALLSSAALAQVPERNHPAKAAPSAPPAKAKVDVTLPISNVQPALPKKPPVVTAVAPKPLVTGGTQRKIIFVGGKPNSGVASLNTQPIPPGRSTLSKSSLNPQPIPPGRPPVDPIR